MPPTSANGGTNNNKKAVRFASGGSRGVEPTSAVAAEDIAVAHPSRAPAAADQRRPLKKRKLEEEVAERGIGDDLLDPVGDAGVDDDVDDDDEYGGGGGVVASARELLDAKRERRTKRRSHAAADDDATATADDDATRIDHRTSLAAEGVPVEPFHMDQERSDGTGYFDGDTYVFRRRRDGDDEEPDAWLDGLDNAAAGGAGENGPMDVKTKQRQQRRRAQDDEEDTEDDGDDDGKSKQSPMDTWTERDLYAQLWAHLAAATDETVTAALVRCGTVLQPPPPKKPRRGIGAVPVATAAAVAVSPEHRKAAQDSLNALTEAANALLLRGEMDVYQMRRSEIAALLALPAAPGVVVVPRRDDDQGSVAWEYRGNQDGAIHGPYSSAEMLGWTRAGYFVGPAAVRVRTVQKAAPASTEVSLQEDLLSDLMDDGDDDDRVKSSSSEDIQPQGLVRGEWMVSDQIDFNKYVR